MDAPRVLVFVEHGDEFVDRHLSIIAVQHVDVDIVCLQALQALQQLPGQRFRVTVGGVGTFIKNDDLLTNTTVVYPLPEHFFTRTTSVDIGRVKASASRSKKSSNMTEACGQLV